MYLGATDPKIQKRQDMERRIVLSTIDELLAQGFQLRVDDGGDEANKLSADRTTIVDDIMNTDEDVLYAIHPAKAMGGWVRFVYGNDGYDVMSDYTVNLENLLPKTMKLVEKLEARA